MANLPNSLDPLAFVTFQPAVLLHQIEKIFPLPLWDLRNFVPLLLWHARIAAEPLPKMIFQRAVKA